MPDLLCAKCSRPILSSDDTATVEQVDACTAAVERVTYHATCRDRNTEAEPASIFPRQSASPQGR
jgi:hypothetical protein